MFDLHVGRENEDANVRASCSDGFGGDESLDRVGRGIRMSMMSRSAWWPRTTSRTSVASDACATTSCPVRTSRLASPSLNSTSSSTRTTRVLMGSDPCRWLNSYCILGLEPSE